MSKKTYNVKGFLARFGIHYNVQSAGSEITINCLWHEDVKHKLYVNATSGLFHCFSCNEKGSFLKLARKIYQLRKKKEVSLKDFETLDVKSVVKVATGDDYVIEYPEHYFPLWENLGHVGAVPAKYLGLRGIGPDLTYYYRIGHCVGGHYDGRIIVPVFAGVDKLVSFIARDYRGNLIPKVLTPPAREGTHGIKDFVFNLKRASSTKHLIIGEGVFDAISLGINGIALFGKTATQVQLAKIGAVKPKRITICLDGDAFSSAETLSRQLSFCSDVRIARLPVGEDPNSIDKMHLRSILSSALAPSLGYSLDFIGA